MQIILSILLVISSVSQPTEESVARVVVSKDSLSFWIPIEDHESLWRWNSLPAGRDEHEWIFNIPLKESIFPLKEGEAHFAVIQKSLGPPDWVGKIKELLENCMVYFWVTNAESGEMFHKSKIKTFIIPNYAPGLISFTLDIPFYVELIARQRPEIITLQGFDSNGEVYNKTVVVNNQRDPKEEVARNIIGPFSADEYAIYQTVLDRMFNFRKLIRSRQAIYILSPTFHKKIDTYEQNNVKVLKADSVTCNNYFANRVIASDLTSLSKLGFSVINEDSFYTKFKHVDKTGFYKVRLSRIGFGNNNTQALVFFIHAGEGEVVLLEKLNGEWLVTRRVTIWQI